MRIDVGWIIIGEIRRSTASLVTDRRCQRKSAEEEKKSWPLKCESINQHNPSFEHRTEAPMLTTSFKERAAIATEERPWSAMEATWVSRTSSSAQAAAWSFGSRRSATLRCGWMSGLTCTRDATHGDVYAEGGARDPSVRIARPEARGVCSSRLLETTRVPRATAGSRVNLHEHARDAKWAVCHAAVMVVLDRESAQDGVVAKPLRKKSLQVNNGSRPKDWYNQREWQRDSEEAKSATGDDNSHDGGREQFLCKQSGDTVRVKYWRTTPLDTSRHRHRLGNDLRCRCCLGC